MKRFLVFLGILFGPILLLSFWVWTEESRAKYRRDNDPEVEDPGIYVQGMVTEDIEFKVLYINIFRAHIESGGTLRATTKDINGTPKSWRLLSNDYTSRGKFFRVYDSKKSYDWDDHVFEATTVNGVPTGSNYRLSSDSEAFSRNYTSFVRITGEGTLGDGFAARIPVPDGNDKTILFVVFKNSGIIWTAPEDLQVNVTEDLEHQPPKLRRWFAEEKRIVIFADGHARQLSAKTSFSDFVAMCTANGKEKVTTSAHKLLNGPVNYSLRAPWGK